MELQRADDEDTPVQVPTPEEQLNELDDLEEASRSGIRFLHVSGIAGVVAFYLGMFIWHPFIVMRSRFAHELDRFALRVQGLASKAELADLAVAEVNVNNEQSLQHFVKAAQQIAHRHDVPELTRNFDLWHEADSRS